MVNIHLETHQLWLRPSCIYPEIVNYGMMVGRCFMGSPLKPDFSYSIAISSFAKFRW